MHHPHTPHHSWRLVALGCLSPVSDTTATALGRSSPWGGVLVVERGVGLDRTFWRLPVLLLDDFSVLNPQMLKQAYVEAMYRYCTHVHLYVCTRMCGRPSLT